MRLAELHALCRARGAEEAALEFVFFWGHQPPKGGGLSPACFSQWWPAPMTIEGQVYPTAEHYMMAEKARLFGDEQVRARVLGAVHPADVKRAGRTVRGFTEHAWEDARERIIHAGSLAKFSQHPDLGAFLLQTGTKVLVEASPTDRIWGIGRAADDPAARDPLAWRGLNLLGFILMDVRAALRELSTVA